jgi:DNA-binding CsgD family transcriptional regulator
MPLGKPLLDALERMHIGGVVTEHADRIVHINPCAAQLLKKMAAGKRERASDLQHTLECLLSKAGRSESSNGEVWALVRGQGSALTGSLIVHASPLDGTLGASRRLVIMVALHTTFEPVPKNLQKVFGLTPTETRIAIELVKGRKLREIAARADVSVGTVRKQLASIYTKTDTHRQAELTLLLARLSILP